MKKISCFLELLNKVKTYWEIITKFCDLLRISELYRQEIEDIFLMFFHIKSFKIRQEGILNLTRRKSMNHRFYESFTFKTTAMSLTFTVFIIGQ